MLNENLSRMALVWMGYLSGTHFPVQPRCWYYINIEISIYCVIDYISVNEKIKINLLSFAYMSLMNTH